MCCCDSQMGLLGLLGATLPAYSQIRVGFHIGALIDVFSSNEASILEQYKQAAEDCLWGSGAFYDVQVQMNPSWTENYMIVSGKTVFDFGSVEDVGGYIQQALEACGVGSIKSRDAVVVDSVPEGTDQQIVNQINLQNQQNTPKPKCDFSKMSFVGSIKTDFFISRKK